jgi:hypothetical protein
MQARLTKAIVILAIVLAAAGCVMLAIDFIHDPLTPTF